MDTPPRVRRALIIASQLEVTPADVAADAAPLGGGGVGLDRPDPAEQAGDREPGFGVRAHDVVGSGDVDTSVERATKAEAAWQGWWLLAASREWQGSAEEAVVGVGGWGQSSLVRAVPTGPPGALWATATGTPTTLHDHGSVSDCPRQERQGMVVRDNAMLWFRGEAPACTPGVPVSCATDMPWSATGLELVVGADEGVEHHCRPGAQVIEGRWTERVGTTDVPGHAARAPGAIVGGSLARATFPLLRHGA